jgi:hypothetical protein
MIIKMNYDVPTAGTRISFVVVDGACSKPPGFQEFHGMTHPEPSHAQVPQTVHNLLLLRQMIDNAIEEQQEREDRALHS